MSGLAARAVAIAEPIIAADQTDEQIEAVLTLLSAPGVTVEGDEALTDVVCSILRGALYSRRAHPDPFDFGD